METNEGFTFTRRTNNRGVKLALSRVETLPKKNNVNQEFVFNRLRPNVVVSGRRVDGQPGRRRVDGQPGRRRVGEQPGRRRVGEQPGRGKLKKKPEAKIQKPEIQQNRENETATESNIQFNVVKKRKTIKLDKSIDFSSGSIIVETPKDVGLSEETIRLEMPVMKEKIKSHEIHKQIENGNVNELIVGCIKFLNEESRYANEVVKHCNANYFSDVDYRKEIEITKGKIEEVKEEIRKWEGIYRKCEETNKIKVEEAQEVEIKENFDEKELIKEFEEKAGRLRVMDEKLRYFFERVEEKSEELLKSIFGSLEEKSVDALFLLKAMSRLGK